MNLFRAWIEPQERPIPTDLLDAAGGSKLAAAALLRRGISSAAAARAFLDPDHYQPTPPGELPGLERIAARLQTSVRSGEPVCVWGDFDVDGQTSTAVLVSTLRSLAGQVSWYIPVRERESHGVHLESLSRVIDQGAKVVLTCDTGSSAHEAAIYAKKRGVDLLITDHHELPENLPDAPLLNPRLLPDGHPLSTLPGVGAAYKLAEALLEKAGRPELAHPLLDLVALGIVADVALLSGDTRWLLQKGLQVLRQGQRPGFQAVLELAEVNPAGLTEEHLGFLLGPRLNALGRLGDANPAVELLTTTDLARARVLAVQLEGMNARRKLLTDQVFQGALAQVEREPTLLDYAALVLAHPGWPAGVIGIVASRLVERFQRPVVLISLVEGLPGRGSARSVEGCDITHAIAAQADLLLSYGGHPMAAGLSLEADKLPEFRRRLSKSVADMLGSRPSPGLEIEAVIPLEQAGLDLAEELACLAPFGPGNPSPTLAACNLVLKSRSLLGRGGEHLQMIVEDENGHIQKVVWWGGTGWPQPEGRFDLAFHLRPTSYRGSQQAQLTWLEFRPSLDAVVIETRPARQVEDLRRQPPPLAALKKLVEQDGAQVWCEAEARQSLHEHGINGKDRASLEPAPILAIWSSPPGPQELAAALEKVNPQVVYLFAVDPQAAGLDAFLKRLAGLAKYALQAQGGRASSARLAGAVGQREAAVRVGLIWLEQRGLLKIVEESSQEVRLAHGSGQGAPTPEIHALLKDILAETQAYREYYRQMDKERLP